MQRKTGIRSGRHIKMGRQSRRRGTKIQGKGIKIGAQGCSRLGTTMQGQAAASSSCKKQKCTNDQRGALDVQEQGVKVDGAGNRAEGARPTGARAADSGFGMGPAGVPSAAQPNRLCLVRGGLQKLPCMQHKLQTKESPTVSHLISAAQSPHGTVRICNVSLADGRRAVLRRLRRAACHCGPPAAAGRRGGAGRGRAAPPGLAPGGKEVQGEGGF